MRNRLAVAGALVVVAFGASGCVADAPPADPTPAPASRDVAAAYRCLIDHSPWTVDVDAAHAEWSATVDDPAHPVTGGEANGTATITFTRDEVSRWDFTATGVDYELYYGDGTRESTAVDLRSSGRYAIPEPGDQLVVNRVLVDAETEDATTTASDGTITPGVAVASPQFPWVAAGRFAFTCTEHRLVFSTPGQVPGSWTLQPGV